MIILFLNWFAEPPRLDIDFFFAVIKSIHVLLFYVSKESVVTLSKLECSKRAFVRLNIPAWNNHIAPLFIYYNSAHELPHELGCRLIGAVRGIRTPELEVKFCDFRKTLDCEGTCPKCVH